MDRPGLSPLLAVVGPTGSGKSELALRIAETFAGEVVNCDSLQVYRGFDIGTAKLTGAERRGIPHHLIDVADPGEVFTAGDYLRLARAALRDIAGRGRLPVVAGGTGLYLRALLEGLFPGPARDPALRSRLERRESRHPGWLHALLARHDPSAAARIHTSDVHKLVRAVEVLLRTRRTVTSWFATQGRDRLAGYRVLKLGLDPPRDALYARIDERCRNMFEGGLLDEVRGLLAAGQSRTEPLESHGYRQAVELLRGETNYARALEEAQRNTRRYAKRQWTWFRRDGEIVWLAGFGGAAGVQRRALEITAEFLSM